MKTRKRTRQAGNAMVEAALTLSLFLTVMFGLFDFGFDLWQYQTIVARARSAVRYGATHPTDTTGMKNMFLYNQTTAGSTPILGLAATNVTVIRSGSGTREDRLTIGITGFRFTRVTLGWAGQKNGYDVTVGIPVEPTS